MSEVLAPPRTATPSKESPAGIAMADPMPVAYALFAFALAMYGVRFISVDAGSLVAGPTSVGLNYAVLVGGIAETVIGLFAIVRGISYPAYVTTTFGIWLLGFYLLVTSGAENRAFTPDALAWYVLVLLVPVTIMAVPAILYRNVPFIVAFAALIALLLLAGLGNHSAYHAATVAQSTHAAPDVSTAVDLLKASAWMAFVAAVALWWVFAREVYRATGVLRNP